MVGSSHRVGTPDSASSASAPNWRRAISFVPFFILSTAASAAIHSTVATSSVYSSPEIGRMTSSSPRDSNRLRYRARDRSLSRAVAAAWAMARGKSPRRSANVSAASRSSELVTVRRYSIDVLRSNTPTLMLFHPWSSQPTLFVVVATTRKPSPLGMSPVR